MPGSFISQDPLFGTASLGSQLRKCYEGGLCNGQREGFGIYTFPNGFFKYEGEWRGGKKHGQGVLRMADGGAYEGEFKDDEITGTGLRTWVDGRSYSGQFLEGEMHGQGVLIHPKGERYEGGWFSNRREGMGVLKYANGDVYEGPFLKNKSSGYGLFRAACGDEYRGSFLDGKRHGMGMQRYANGDSYDGEWLRGVRHGKGRWVEAATGIEYCGLFEGDKQADEPARMVLISSRFELPDRKLQTDAPPFLRAAPTGEIPDLTVAQANYSPTETPIPDLLKPDDEQFLRILNDTVENGTPTKKFTPLWLSTSESGRLICMTLHEGEPQPQHVESPRGEESEGGTNSQRVSHVEKPPRVSKSGTPPDKVGRPASGGDRKSGTHKGGKDGGKDSGKKASAKESKLPKPHVTETPLTSKSNTPESPRAEELQAMANDESSGKSVSLCKNGVFWTFGRQCEFSVMGDEGVVSSVSKRGQSGLLKLSGISLGSDVRGPYTLRFVDKTPGLAPGKELHACFVVVQAGERGGGNAKKPRAPSPTKPGKKR